MQGLTNLRGKSFTLATSGVEEDIRSVVPLLFTNVPNKDDRYDALYLIEISSVSNFSIRLQNNYDDVWTDIDLISSGSPKKFYISEVSVKNIKITPSINGQVFYGYCASL